MSVESSEFSDLQPKTSAIGRKSNSGRQRSGRILVFIREDPHASLAAIKRCESSVAGFISGKCSMGPPQMMKGPLILENDDAVPIFFDRNILQMLP